MGKDIYGGRWKTVSSAELGGGGQGTVFRVVDIRGEHAGEFALKRVKKPRHRERFRREVEAIKRLSHPNIVSLIDHSALDQGGVAKSFLVMPIAKGGNLAEPKRLTLYKGSIDATLKVAQQLAAALGAAHKADVIHRDVKPQNILFPGVGHEIWLSDFGICLLREEPRVTFDREVVGPRVFMAPELEAGGKLGVTAAADIYSLGKVIFYMITGGTLLPRERLSEPGFREAFPRGERYDLLHMLLDQMICEWPQRIQEISEVEERLGQIAEWEQQARVSPLGRETLGAITQLQQDSMRKARTREELLAAHARMEERTGRVAESVVLPL
jgi:serine/threonine protein kinase